VCATETGLIRPASIPPRVSNTPFKYNFTDCNLTIQKALVNRPTTGIDNPVGRKAILLFFSSLSIIDKDNPNKEYFEE